MAGGVGGWGGGGRERKVDAVCKIALDLDTGVCSGSGVVWLRHRSCGCWCWEKPPEVTPPGLGQRVPQSALICLGAGLGGWWWLGGVFQTPFNPGRWKKREWWVPLALQRAPKIWHQPGCDAHGVGRGPKRLAVP